MHFKCLTHCRIMNTRQALVFIVFSFSFFINAVVRRLELFSNFPGSRRVSHFCSISERCFPALTRSVQWQGTHYLLGLAEILPHTEIESVFPWLPPLGSHPGLYGRSEQNRIFLSRNSASSFSQSSGDKTSRCSHFFLRQWHVCTKCLDVNTGLLNQWHRVT